MQQFFNFQFCFIINGISREPKDNNYILNLTVENYVF